jgi:hypothetical protein
MRRSTKWMLLGGTIGAAAGLIAGWGTVVRPWHLRWGATDDEFSKPLPFDELVPSPNFYSTRAVNIAARADEIWPFLVDAALLPFGTSLRYSEEPRLLVMVPPEQQAEATWVVVLEPHTDGTTRLISRNRARFPARASAVLRYLLVDPGQFVVERNWLLTIRERAEALARAVELQSPIDETPVPEKLEPVES